MAYNFKSIADVEVVAEPTESANVLIEENGVIKKAPKTAVGGASGEADLVIRIDTHPGILSFENINIVSGSIEAVYTVFENGLIPKVEVEVMVPPSKNSYCRAGYKITPQIIFYGDDFYINFVCSVFGEAPYAVRIVYDSANNYALSNYFVKQITTTDI